jgi:hypothetical protein
MEAARLMARGGAKRKRRGPKGYPAVDATPERFAKGDTAEFINPAEIDSSEQPIGRVRRFVNRPRLDRWHISGVITQRQYSAGDRYRTLHQRAFSEPRVVSAYGERTTGGQPDYGLARTDAQQQAREKFRMARLCVPSDMLGFIDRFILKNSLPAHRGRAQMRTITQARNALDALAEHFERGG